MWKTANIAANFLLFLCAARVASAQTIDLCDVIARPDIFDKKTIVVDGEMVTDFMHFGGISSTHCSEKFLPVIPKAETVNRAQMKSALEEMRKTPNVHVTATIAGTVESRPGKVPYVVLFAETYSNIEVIPAPAATK